MFTVPKRGRTKPVSASQVRVYAGKAEEYALAAASEPDAGVDDRSLHPWVLGDGVEDAHGLGRFLPFLMGDTSAQWSLPALR